jgi:RNA polymerase sigma-70 factor (ECF subfamily)
MTARAANLFKRSGLKAALLPYAVEPKQSKATLAVTKPEPTRSSSADGPLVKNDSTAEAKFEMAACVARVRERDEDAARSLFSELYPLVMKLVRSHLPRRTSEEDLAQMVFMKVFAKIDQFSGTVPFEHWVSRIAVNTCLNQLQAEKIRPELRWADLSEDEERFLDALPSTAGDFPDPADDVASRDLVNKLLAKLNAEDRLLINLIHLEGHSIEEVKQMTGWNSSLIKVRVFRARHKLKKHFANLMEERKS